MKKLIYIFVFAMFWFAPKVSAQTFWTLPGDPSSMLYVQLDHTGTMGFVYTVPGGFAVYQYNSSTPLFTYVNQDTACSPYSAYSGTLGENQEVYSGDYDNDGRREMLVYANRSLNEQGVGLIDLVTNTIKFVIMPEVPAFGEQIRLIGQGSKDFDGDGVPDLLLGSRPYYNQPFRWIRVYKFTGNTVAVPQDHVLRDNSLDVIPNPSVRQASVRLNVAQEQMVEVSVYDVSGRRVDTIQERSRLASGPTHLVWRPKSGTSGVYFIRAQGESFQATSRAIVLK